MSSPPSLPAASSFIVSNPEKLADGRSKLPLGEFEGAFLPCTFWLAAAHAMRGQPERGEAILDAAEAVAGQLGLFAEGIEPRSKTFLGNMPLLFSHAEYLRAVFKIAKAPHCREQP